MSFYTWLKIPVAENDEEWLEVEDEDYIDHSPELVVDSLELVPAASVFPEVDVLALFLDIQMVNSIFDSVDELVINHGARVDMGNFDDDFEGHEVNDRVLDGVLIKQHVNIQNLGHYVDQQVGVGDHIWDAGVLKLIVMVHDVLH